MQLLTGPNFQPGSFCFDVVIVPNFLPTQCRLKELSGRDHITGSECEMGKLHKILVVYSCINEGPMSLTFSVAPVKQRRNRENQPSCS